MAVHYFSCFWRFRMKVWHTFKSQIRSPFVFLIHLTAWVLFFIQFEYITDNSVDKILQTLIDEFHVILILSIITSYRFARGKLNGIANTQQEWMNWYNNQEQVIPKHNLLPQSLPEYFNVSLILNSVKDFIITMFRSPLLYVFQFVCWHYVFFLGELLDEPMLYTIRENESLGIYWILDSLIAEMLHEYIYGFIAITLFAFTTFIQDVIGKLVGITQEHRQWLKWHEDHNESFTEEKNIDQTPSLIKNETGLLFVKCKPIFSIVYVLIVTILFFIFALELIQFTEWNGIKYLGWIALLVLLLR